MIDNISCLFIAFEFFMDQNRGVIFGAILDAQCNNN